MTERRRPGVRRALAAAALGWACSSEDPSSSPAHQLTVGVIPYTMGMGLCPQGPSRESAHFRMDDENDTRCSYESGDAGEPRWPLPLATKYPFPPSCLQDRTHTLLRFCRASVPEDAFKPLTTDPLDRAQFYALLKFGDRCPNHAVEVTKVIVNEDQDTQNAPTNASALLYPNEIVGRALGNFTRLVFCYFRNAPSAHETMSGFPDLGIPYAVFHDFEGPQPGWVIRKRWQHSDDSNQAQPANRYYTESSLEEILDEFAEIIENPVRGSARDTYFEMARVR